MSSSTRRRIDSGAKVFYPAAGLERMVSNIEHDWRAMSQVELTRDVRALIPALAARTSLRGADLVHLASAQMVKQSEIDLTFVSSDRRLLLAANEVGHAVVDPADSPAR